MSKNLGIGVGLRPAFYDEFLNDSPPQSVSWVEVISENYMRWEDGFLPTKPISKLEKVRRNRSVVLHGVSMSLGSADPLNISYMNRLKELVDRIEPSHVSDHLCWTGVNGENLHDLLPLPYTAEAIDHVVEKIKIAQDFLGRRILIENLSSYVNFKQSEMTEWNFLSEIVNRADCGILLDINNVYVSSVNHQFDPIEYLNSIPFERVGQIHLAGHTEKNGYLVDTHDESICQNVWNLYEWYVKSKGVKSTMIERDGNIPDFVEIEKELLLAAKIAEQKGGKYERVITGAIASAI